MDSLCPPYLSVTKPIWGAPRRINEGLRRRTSGKMEGLGRQLDSNILTDGLSGVSAQCQDLLDRRQREEITGSIRNETVTEVTHRLMVAEAVSMGLIDPGGAR